MGLIDKLRGIGAGNQSEASDSDTGSDQMGGAGLRDSTAGPRPDTPGPAAASGDSSVPSAPPAGEVSEGPSGFGNEQTVTGGADDVPDTPDTVAQDYT